MRKRGEKPPVLTADSNLDKHDFLAMYERVNFD